MVYKFEVYKDAKEEWRFRLVAPNGQIIAVGESYKNKGDCLSTVNSIKENAPDAEVIEVEGD